MRFLSEGGAWDFDASRARDFGAIYRAAQHCAAAKLTNVHIIIAKADGSGNLASRSRVVVRVPKIGVQDC